MSRTANKLITATSGSAAGAFEIDQSLIFDKTDAASLVRTPGSASNQRTWTWSGWVKRLETNGSHIFTLFSADGSSDNSYICFYLDDIYINDYEAGVGTKWQLTTNRKFRDFGTWYHIVLAVDTTQGTASNRLKLYVNGVQETSFSAASYPAQNYDGFVNSTKEHHVGTAFTSASNYSLGGQLAEVNFVDGSQLAPSSFGETNSDTNQWIPKKYSGSYGTNGFYLKFVSGALGTDSSGEGNNFTSANLANSDVVTDTPTNNFCTLNSLSNYNAYLTQGNLRLAQAGHSDTAATFQIPFTGKWYFECVATTAGAAQVGMAKTSYIPSAGSWVTGKIISLVFGSGNAGVNGSESSYIGSAIGNGDTVGVAIDSDNGKIYFAKNNTWGNSGNPLNGTNPAATFTATDGWQPIIYGPSGAVQTFNFGQRTFTHTPPTGYLTLSSSNLPEPAIAIPSAHFNTHIYTGSNNANAITGVGFQPDWVWVKQRDVGYNHQLHDSVRGAAAGLLMSDNNAAQNSTYPIASFDSNGFTPDSGNVTGVNTGSMVGWFWKAGGSTPSKTYVVKVVSDSGNKYRFDDFGTSAQTIDLQEGGTYTFDQSDSSNSGHPFRFSTTSNGSHGGGSEYTTGVTTSGTPGSAGAYTRITVAASAATLYYYCTAHSGMGGQANTNSTYGSSDLKGSIPSIVSTNETAGFSIGKYTGAGGLKTVGHGLGKVPALIILKSTSHAIDYCVYHQEAASSPEDGSLTLNDAAGFDDNDNRWNDTAPTSSVFTVYSSNEVNDSGKTYVYYAFAEIEGFSKFGTYIANNTANTWSPFINTGFTPSWIVFKYISGNGEWWWMLDSTRDPINLNTQVLYTNDAAAESAIGSSGGVDFLSNGFKIKATNGGINSANTYAYMAFAEAPFKYANAR